MARPKKNVEAEPTGELSLREKAAAIKDKVNGSFKTKLLQMFDEEDDLTVKRLSSGILSLDMILGQGQGGWGWPVGRISEIFGPESAGKSSVVLKTIATAQAAGGICVLIDAEHVFDPSYARALGVDVEALLVCNPDTGEQGYNAVESLASVPGVTLIVVDSVEGMVPMAVTEGEFEDQFIGNQPRLNNRFVKVISPIIHKNDVTLLLVNQIREKTGGYGNPEITPGGRGIKFAASVRLEVRRAEDVEESGLKIGHIMRGKTVKNKTARPQQIAEFRLDWGVGFNRGYCLANQGVNLGVIEKSGAWFRFDGQQWQGNKNLSDAFNSDDVLAAKLEKAILENDRAE